MPRKDNTYNDFLPLHDGLVEFASMLLKSRDDAEDAVQDLFLKLWKRKDTLSEIENPEAYCKTVLRNICLDNLKSAEQKNKGDMPEDQAGSVSVEDSAIVKEQLANPAQAYAQLEKTFETISSKVDKGTAIARSAGTKLEKAEDIMDKVNLKK